MAQLDSASVFGTEGCRFESCRACWTYDDSPIPDTQFTLNSAQVGIVPVFRGRMSGTKTWSAVRFILLAISTYRIVVWMSRCRHFFCSTGSGRRSQFSVAYASP